MSITKYQLNLYDPQVRQQWPTVEDEEVAEVQIAGSTPPHLAGEALVDPHSREKQDRMMEEEKGTYT